MQDEEVVRARLLSERAALVRASAGTDGLRAAVDADEQSLGRLSRMDSLMARAMALATEERRRQRLARIDAALKRLDQGR